MSARRQASTTSLSRYARAQTPEAANRSLDFCNAFWGFGDAGVDVLFARMRGAMRTMDELRNFWKERAMIEEQYAKRLASLAKFTLGRDEIGEMRASFEVLRQETEKQAAFHNQVAQQIKADLEGQTTAFLNKQQQHKKTFQAAIEKEFRTKQTQESYVNKAREKYETDCMRINALTAQATLMQGKDLEKNQIKLDRAQQTVQANERDFANFSRALQDTVQKWEQDWKMFCDSCQDLEEERLEFMKDNMWAYANAVSTVCVADDESCEKLRLALEQLEPDKDMENFVRDYGTGSAMPDPPHFVNYASPDAVPSSSQRPTTRPANFVRSSQRTRPAPSPVQQQPPPLEPEPEPINMTGVGAATRRPDSVAEPARSQSRASTRTGQQSIMSNGHAPAPTAAAPRQQTFPTGMRPADADADPIDPTAKTMIKVGANAWEVDLARDPQAGRPGPTPMQNGAAASAASVGQPDDPLARQMQELRSASSAGGGSVRRSGQWRQSTGPMAVQPSPSPTKKDPSGKLSPAPGSNQPSRNYRHSAEIVVGAYPIQPTSSRPASPSPPTAAFMRPPTQTAGPSGGVPVQEVLADYQQSLPGERKSISRSNSRRGSIASAAAVSPTGQLQRPVSAEGHAGIGAQGRSTSPQPFSSASRSASPNAAPSVHRNSQRIPPPAMQSHPSARQGSLSTTSSMTVPPSSGHQQRSASPSIGIALDPNGRVAMDSMRDIYVQQQQHHAPPPQQQPPSQFRPPQQQPVQQQPPLQQQHVQQHPAQQQIQRRPSYNMGPNGAPVMAPPQSQPPAAAPVHAPAPTGYGAPAAMYGAPYGHAPAPVQQPPYGYQNTPQQPVYQQPPTQQYAPSPQNTAVVNSVHRAPSMNGYYPQGALVHQQQPSQHMAYRAPSPARVPSPQRPAQAPPPTGNYTEDGRGILFYVKALYDYQATIDEEFDFQAGDIIAVTATPEDGWWSGELLDDARRQPGRHVFPSNFVTLF
ncbi:hypothetical protein CERSUDRAFT_118390 [Gelatoporia subvermispora B]|uniref:SH3 domain-containing protein n=1 Tax=Ceriporiopsis subvermispora (strain B) TaxID=914234 RepID=M2R447_CERS8|nr:hypothetical protein CERSUDRAFT_118390 [Gelatoporia subvermispora B]